jgi:hypothetical protein
MTMIRDVTDYFQVEKIHDAILAEGFVAVAADSGLAAVQMSDGVLFRFRTNRPIEGPMLVSGLRVFIDRHVGEPRGNAIEFKPLDGLEMDRVPLPHYSFATKQCLYTLNEDGDLHRFRIDEGRSEVPDSPYGRYAHDDHRVVGIASSRNGVIALSRYEGRAELLLDALPDDSTRHKARAAVLKDADFGDALAGPAVAGRWAHLYCPSKGCLLSQHLRNPEVRHETAVEAEGRPLLAADGAGRVWMAVPGGLILAIGPGSPAFLEFPGGEVHEPMRLIVEERFALVTTRAGRLFLAEH